MIIDATDIIFDKDNTVSKVLSIINNAKPNTAIWCDDEAFIESLGVSNVKFLSEFDVFCNVSKDDIIIITHSSTSGLVECVGLMDDSTVIFL